MSETVSTLIPTLDPSAQFASHENAIRAAVERVLSSGWYVLGEEVAAFEKQFADFIGAVSCVGVANGTDALAMCLRACGVEPGQEVVTVSHSAVATVAGIEQAGAVPVLADIDPVRRCLDPEALESLIGERTAALVVVHIYGQPADMNAILAVAARRGLKVVEDCAQAHGAAIDGRNVGTFGDAAAFSFYPTKNLGALGDGGAVVTNSEEIATRVRELREYGWRDRYVSAIPGYNSRLDELQAAILRAKLPSLEADTRKRRSIADRYRTALDGKRILGPADVPGTEHAMHLFVVETNERDCLCEHLRNAGVGTALHYPMPIHLQPAYAGRFRGGDRLPRTERLYRRILSLPMYPELTASQVETVTSALRAWCREL